MRRRTFLRTALGAGSLAGLSGCAEVLNSPTGSDSERRATLDRILVRSDTGTAESLYLRLVYAPRDDSTERPLWGTFEAPASGEAVPVGDFSGDPGFYSLTAYSDAHSNMEGVSFNSYGDAVGRGPVQFEVVVKETGDLWTNLNEAGASISIPGS